MAKPDENPLPHQLAFPPNPIATTTDESAEEDIREDKEDLENAHEQKPPIDDRKPWWKTLGPGLITGAADDDPSGVGTYSVTGAQFGYLCT